MSDAERRSILSQVAEGTLSPDEAAERLAALDRDRATHDHPGASRPSAKTAAGGERGLPPGAPASRIRIVGSVRLVEIVGDANVKEASVEGPHDARREGDLLIIEGEGPEVAWSQPGWRWNWNWTGEGDGEDDEDGAERKPKDWYVGYKSGAGWSSGRTRQRVRVAGFPGAAAFAEGLSGARQRRSPALKVRVNPNLPLEAGIKAGSMSIAGVSAPITAEADAASLQIKGFTAPLDVKVNAGKLEATGLMNQGESRIECNAGKVDIRLEAGSRVKITARAELSRINLPSSEVRSGGLLGSEHEALIGDGGGTLFMEVNVGSATVALTDENG